MSTVNPPLPLPIIPIVSNKSSAPSTAPSTLVINDVPKDVKEVEPTAASNKENTSLSNVDSGDEDAASQDESVGASSHLLVLSDLSEHADYAHYKNVTLVKISDLLKSHLDSRAHKNIMSEIAEMF